MRTVCLLLLAAFLAAQAPVPAGAPPRLGVVVFEDDQAGLVVDKVRAGTAAAKAGIKVGDRIVKLGDIDVREDRDLVRALAGLRPGHTTNLEVVRGGARTQIPLTFTAAATPTPKDDSVKAARAALEKAKRALAGKAEDPAVREALTEIAKADEALAKLAKAPSRSVTAQGSGGDTSKVMERVEELMSSGATPEEIEEKIAAEFPGVRIKIGGGAPDQDWSGQPPAGGK